MTVLTSAEGGGDSGDEFVGSREGATEVGKEKRYSRVADSKLRPRQKSQLKANFIKKMIKNGRSRLTYINLEVLLYHCRRLSFNENENREECTYLT
jgi:hypothetical protein